MDATIAVKSLTENGFDKEKLHIMFIVIHLIYDFANLSLIYICGHLMNRHHKEYYKVLCRQQMKLLRNTDLKPPSDIQAYLQCASLIPKNSDFQFIPSFCGFSIPLDNLGY